MKRLINFLTLSCAFALVAITSTGCLKDKYVDDGLAGPEIYKSPKLIELMGTEDATTSYQSSSVIAFDIGTQIDTTGLVFARLAGNDPAPEDIKVQLELVPSLLEAYNDTNGTHLEPLPANLYTLSSNDMTITIPKGEREGALDITLIPNDLLTGEYALAFRIKSVSNPEYQISGNFNNAVVIIGVKNQYDGVYEVTGVKFVDQINPLFTGLYPLTVHLITTGPNSVAFYDPDGFHDYIHPMSNNGNFSGYGSFTPEFFFDASGNGVVTNVLNYYGNPAGNGRSGAIDPTGENKMDMSTRTMKVKYFMLQPGSSVRVAFDETFTYVGPR